MAIYSRSSGKTNVLFNLIKMQDNKELIDKTYWIFLLDKLIIQIRYLKLKRSKISVFNSKT